MENNIVKKIFCPAYRVDNKPLRVAAFRLVCKRRRELSHAPFVLFSVLAPVLLCLTFVADVAAATSYYVDVDSIGGPSSDNNLGTIDQPFRTIEKARDTIRETEADGVTVYIREGTYYLTEPLKFNEQDSGSAGSSNTYTAYSGEEVIISGGKELDSSNYPWTIYSGNIYKTNVGSLRFNSLFIDNQRAIRAREPDVGYYHVSHVDNNNNYDSFGYYEGDIDPNWTNINQVEMQYHHEWTAPRERIDYVDDENNYVWFQSRPPYRYWARNKYYIENVFEGLDTPGEWYLNNATGDLYYYPLGGKNPNGSKIVIPLLGYGRYEGALVNVRGITDYVEYLSFEGLTFAHTEWYLPAGGNTGWSMYTEEYNTRPSLCFIKARYCTLKNSIVVHTGGNGLTVWGDHFQILNNEFSDIGASAIRFGFAPGSWYTDIPITDNEITDNIVHDVGKAIRSAEGIQLISKLTNNVVSHNLLYNIPKTGISIGYNVASNISTNNRIEYNHLYNVQTALSDSSALYMSGPHVGGVIKNNKVHDIPSLVTDICPDVGGRGIYIDEGAEDIIVSNNLVYRVATGLVLHACKNNTITNNIFTSDTEDGSFIVYSAGSGNIVTKNIFYSTALKDMLGTAAFSISESDYNCYYSTAGWTQNDLANWKSWKDSDGEPLDYDANSIEQDPLFVNYSSDNFNLDPNSPVLGLGFEQIDMGGVGPRTTISGSDPNAPVLQAIGNKSVNENSALIFDVNATDPDGDAITYSTWNLPSGATFSNQTFSWTPSYDQAGTYHVRFIATDDGNAYDYETITSTVNNVNRAPVLGSITDQSVNETALLSFSVSATDADGQTITYSVSGLPAGAVFASQTFTWTPSYDQAGTHSVTFIADDGQAQDSQTITITVINVNRAPVLTAIGNRTAYADVLLTFTIDATDPDGNAITYSAGTLPSGATFTDHDFNWTPSQSQVGSYAVTFIASDGQLQDSETVTLTVDVDSLAPTVTNCSPAAGSIQVPLNNLITLNIADAGIGVNADSVKIKIRVNDNPNNDTIYFGDTDHYTSPYGDCRRLGTKSDYRFVYQSTNEMFYYDQTVTITVNATDLAGNVMNEYSYSFATEMHSFGQNKQVNSGLDNNDRPVTVCDSSGNIWAAWHAGPIDNRDIYISKLTAGEENFNSTIQLTNNANDQCNPAVALDSNDKLYVVWQDNREGDWDIYVSTSVDGISWSIETRVNDPNDGNQVNPAIVIDGQDYAHVVWQDDRADNQDICIATSSDGFATKTVTQITSNTFDQVEPAVAADSDNTIYVVWTDGRNGSNDIYGAASNNPWTNVAIVSNTNNQSSPAIATESTGSILHLLWIDDTSGDNDIYYASSNGLPGSPLTGSSIIDDSSGADQLDPTIAVTGSTDNNLKVFACWQDWRNTDTDLYFAELSSGSGTNVFVGDSGSNAEQGKPVIGIDEYSHPYFIWADNRSTDKDIYYAGSTFIEPIALASELVTASAPSSTIVGTDPQAITTVDDVSIVVPAGACSYDVTITLTKIANLPAFAAPCLGGYDFGPSGIQFSQPVTITIPYVFSSSDGSVTPYWFNSLTGALSQQGITDIQDITISSSLHALSFKTTHFTAFFLLAGGGTSAAIVGGGGGGGGCSVSASGEGNIVEYILPYIGLAIVMAILKMRDTRERKARNMTTGKY